MMLAGDRSHGHLQHTVDAVFHHDGIVVGLDVDVGCAPFQRREDGGIHQPDDGAYILFAGELFNGDVLVAVFVASEHIEGEPFAGLVQDALRLLSLLEQVRNLAEGCDASNNPVSQQPGNLIQHHEPRGVADGDHQFVCVLLKGHEVVAEHQFHRHGAQQVVLDFEVLQIDKLRVIAVRQRLSLCAFVLTCWQRQRNEICVSHIRLPRPPARLSQRKDWQVERNQNEHYNHAHDNQDGRLNQSQ